MRSIVPYRWLENVLSNRYPIFFIALGSFSGMDHHLDHKASPNVWKNANYSIFSGNNTRKLEINDRGNFGNYMKLYRSYSWVINRSRKEFLSILNENENASHQNMYSAWAVLSSEQPILHSGKQREEPALWCSKGSYHLGHPHLILEGSDLSPSVSFWTRILLMCVWTSS